MKPLSEYSTKELITELRGRLGVESSIITPSEQFEVAVDQNRKYRTDGIHGKMHTGPAVILVVID